MAQPHILCFGLIERIRLVLQEHKENLLETFCFFGCIGLHKQVYSFHSFFSPFLLVGCSHLLLRGSLQWLLICSSRKWLDSRRILKDMSSPGALFHCRPSYNNNGPCRETQCGLSGSVLDVFVLYWRHACGRGAACEYGSCHSVMTCLKRSHEDINKENEDQRIKQVFFSI